MNHVDKRNKTTDIYISANWDIVDEVQEGTISLLRLNPSRKINNQNGSCNICSIGAGILPSKVNVPDLQARSEEHTSELQSLMRISYAVFCLKKKKKLSNITLQKPTTYQ